MAIWMKFKFFNLLSKSKLKFRNNFKNFVFRSQRTNGRIILNFVFCCKKMNVHLGTITGQTIVNSDITSSYELNQRPNRLAADTSTLIRRLSGQV